jgi:putative phage-type endonuclease
MQTHNLIQGTPEWHDYRAKHFNASDCPAMLGISQYKTRSKLLQEMATGIGQEFDAATERRFADGHRFEALARPVAEQIIGADLYPITASEGKLSASFDGLTMDEMMCFEHKSLNDGLRAAFSAGQIPEQYRAQMEQQLMISGARQCLFMASKWNDNDELIEELHVMYSSDQAMRDRIVQGWVQFAKDLENYTPPEVIEKPVADAIMGLPAVSIQATGMITASNLPEFKKAADTFIANIKTELVTDEDFVNAEANVKFCKSAEDDLEGTKKAILAQTTTIDEAIKTIDYIKGQLASKRLILDKLVKSEKEARKLAIISKAGIDFSAHVEGLESETRPIQLNVARPDFAGAIKGLKKLSAMQDAIDTALANGKIAADTVAKDVRIKLAWFRETANGYEFLFPDLQTIIYL